MNPFIREESFDLPPHFKYISAVLGTYFDLRLTHGQKAMHQLRILCHIET